MNRFIVCGRWDDGILRVLDTDDFVVEEATIEQLKVLQSMGYSVVFNNRYDFLYRLFWITNMEVAKPFLFDMMELTDIFLPYDVKGYQFESIKNRANRVSIFCVMSSDDIVLFSIRAINRAYKLFYKRFKYSDLTAGFVRWTINPLSLRTNGFAISYCSIVPDIVRIEFDYECNIVKE